MHTVASLKAEHKTLAAAKLNTHAKAKEQTSVLLILAAIGMMAFAPVAEAKQKKKMLTTQEVYSSVCQRHQTGASVENLWSIARLQLNQGINLDKALIGLSDVEKIRYKYDHDASIISNAGVLIEAVMIDPKCRASR